MCGHIVFLGYHCTGFVMELVVEGFLALSGVGYLENLCA